MGLSRRRALLLARLHRRRTREREGLFLVEGVRAVRDAVKAGAEIRFGLRSPALARSEEGRVLSAALEEAGVEVEDVEEAELARVADTETPQGVLVVCAEPRWALDALDGGSTGRPRVLLLDAVRDPGNAGTLIRTAAAFDVPGVVALDGTVDPWSPKTVRATSGGIFRTRIVTASWEDAGRWLASRGLRLLAAEADGRDVAGVAGDLGGGGWALAVGNEGGGLRPELRGRADHVVSIPMPGPAESLNAAVAGSILLYELTRARSPAREGGAS